MKRMEGGVLNEVEELRDEGRQLVGRLKKKWGRYVTEDMNNYTVNRGIYGTRSIDVEDSHHPSKPHKLQNMDVKRQ